MQFCGVPSMIDEYMGGASSEGQSGRMESTWRHAFIYFDPQGQRVEARYGQGSDISKLRMMSQRGKIVRSLQSRAMCHGGDIG